MIIALKFVYFLSFCSLVYSRLLHDRTFNSKHIGCINKEEQYCEYLNYCIPATESCKRYISQWVW